MVLVEEKEVGEVIRICILPVGDHMLLKVLLRRVLVLVIWEIINNLKGKEQQLIEIKFIQSDHKIHWSFQQMLLRSLKF